jgi:hypothetical protein
MSKTSENKIIKNFIKLKDDLDEHILKHGSGIWDKIADKALDKGIDIIEKKISGGDIWDKIADKAVDKGFDVLSQKLGLGIEKGLKGRGFDDATIRPLMKEIGTWINPGTLVGLGISGKGIEDANPLYLGYQLGHDVIAPNLMKVLPPSMFGLGIKPINSHNESKQHQIRLVEGTGRGLRHKKGSREAKEWGAKMKALREAKKRLK